MGEIFSTRFYEIASRKTRGGKRPIKFILHRIMDSPEDFQANGVSWKEEYVKQAIQTIAPADISVEYLRKGLTADDTEISGHGYLNEMLDADGNQMPVFNENSEVVGSITGAEIQELTLDGQLTKCLVADGVLYEQRCKGLVDWLKQNVPLGNVMGSVEIVGTPENNNIIKYEDGYKPQGRVPMEYEYSGYSILSAAVPPADDACHVLEVAQKKEVNELNEEQMRAFVDELKAEMHSVYDLNQKLTSEMNELAACGADKDKELAAAVDNAAKLQAALDQVNGELQALRTEDEAKWQEQQQKYDTLYAERETIHKELARMKVAKRLAELDTALSGFTEQEKNYAAPQIEAFKADPMGCEVNSVTDAIYLGIGKQKKEAAPAETPAGEQNQQHDIDIFSEVNVEPAVDNDSIF